jgi:hypothetical protein
MQPRLVALRIERRIISAAVFEGHHLEHADSLHLASTYPKALDGATGYINRIKTMFLIETALVEKQTTSDPTWRAKLTTKVVSQLRGAGVPVFEIDPADLLPAFRNPPAQSRAEVRRSVGLIWPSLVTDKKHCSCLDAAALGLYFQIQRLLSPN